MERRETPRTLSRRRWLKIAGGLAALGPLSVVVSACGGPSLSDVIEQADEPGGESAISNQPPPTATPEPEPFIVPEGVQEHAMMAGTPQQNRLYVFGSGREGPIVLALGGVHGNEPGGWLAAEQVVDGMRPAFGALLVVPRANRLATLAFVRTTDELGDLNRLYPGNPDGLPMERMAFEIMNTIREYHVNVVVDMHESWAFYKDRTQNGTAFLGQTIATNPSEPGISLARSIVDAVNTRIRYPHEELFYREFPRGRLPGPTSALPNDTSGNPAAAVSGGSRSSLGLPSHVPGLVSLLVEMGQQQALDRRVALHVDVLREVLRQVGVEAA
jgi:hypothetical protein